MSQNKNIVVLGSSHAALRAAHTILNSIIPSLPNSQSYKLVIISPSNKVFWNIAAPRAILGLTPDKVNPPPSLDQIFGDIEAAFKKRYGNGKDGKVRWEFIEAFARKVDPDVKRIQFERVSGKEDSITFVGGDERKWESIDYEQLVIATGTRPQPAIPVSALHKTLPPPPFKGLGTASQTKSALKEWAQAIADSKTIILGGAGPLGVETSGELADAYPDKKIILVSAEPQVLPRLSEKVGKTAQKMLGESGVELRLGTKLKSVQVDEHAVRATLSSGEVLDVDLYIPTHHAFVPSTEFLPSSIKDSAGFLLMSNHLNNPTYPDIWGAGDVTAFPNNKNLSIIDKQILIMAGNLKASMLKAAGQGKVKQLETYEHEEDAPAAVPIGRKKGTGQMGGWKIWSFVVYFVKGRDFMVGMMQGLLDGSKWVVK